MEIFVALAVIVIILLGALVMTLLRLAAAATAISAGVARIGTEVSETTAAIRAHLEGDSGISQSELLSQVEKLEAAGAALTEAANSLDSLQTELGANAGAAGGGEPAPDPAPEAEEPHSEDEAADDAGGGGDAVGDQPAPDVDPAVTDDAAQPGDGAEFGNQNGIGSEFEQGAGGGAIDVNNGGDGGEGDSPSLTGGDAPAALDEEPAALEVGAAITYHDNAFGAPAPNPAIGTVIEVTGDNDYSVSVQNANDSFRTEENVGQRSAGNKPDRYIEPREGNGGGIADPPAGLELAGQI